MRKASAYAPGRVELLGNHTDYNEGFVLSAAIDKGTTARLQSRDDGQVHVSSESFEEPTACSVADLKPLTKGHWANYPLGVAAGLIGEGFNISGFGAEFSSTLPLGAGLSSSAALEVATATGLAKLFDFAIAPLRLAQICRNAEREFAGVNAGVLDQISSVFGKRDHVIYLDCRTEQVRLVKFPADAVLLIINSGVPHRLVGGEYNERREQCAEAARLLGVRFLRDATREQLETARPWLSDIVYRRALHIVGENERVQQAAVFLEEGRMDQFGRLMRESHTSSQVNFENSTPELDLLVDIACDHREIFGSRLTGGGFGGATVSIVKRDRALSAAEEIAAEYNRRSGQRATTFICQIADGAH